MQCAVWRGQRNLRWEQRPRWRNHRWLPKDLGHLEECKQYWRVYDAIMSQTEMVDTSVLCFTLFQLNRRRVMLNQERLKTPRTVAKSSTGANNCSTKTTDSSIWRTSCTTTPERPISMGRDWCSSASLAAFNHGNQKEDDDVENHGSCAKCPFYLHFWKGKNGLWHLSKECPLNSLSL